MQGHNVPWCVGSVFFPPQLLTSDLGPSIINPLGNPQRLLSTGQRLQNFETTISTSKQAESFLDGNTTPFIPRDLLHGHLVSDSSRTQIGQFCGNLLQGLKCSDGSIVVFFICGEGSNRIASTVFHQGSNERWSSIRNSLSSQCLDDSEQTDWSVSPSLEHSIQQLSAVWSDCSGKGGTGLAIVAARTDYRIYFCTVSIEEDRVQFISTATSKFQVPTAHVTWSPHVHGRAAVVLDSGALCLFEVKDSQNSNLDGIVELTPTAILKCPMQRPFAKLSSQGTAVRQNQDEERGHNELHSGSDIQDVAVEATENVPELEKKWWCCEFGWLPHTLLVANSQEIFLVDLTNLDSTFDSSRKTEVDVQTSTSGINLMANVGTSEYSRFCLLKSQKENIVAFGRDCSDGVFEFSVATEHHVLLFDTRQPQTPILQWEHALRDPPSLLIMCPLSALQSFHDKEKLKDIQNGRVILAVSFRSGDIRVFRYGSGVSVIESPMGNNSKKQKVQGKEWGSATYAWDIPSRLHTPLAKVDDWRYVLSSSQGLYSHGLYEPKSCKGGQTIAGIVLLSEKFPESPCYEGTKSFTILQLTGQGELLAQAYAASHDLQDPPTVGLSSIDDESDADVSESVQRPSHRELKFEVLPTFLKYICTGSILNPHSSRYSEKEGIVADDVERTLYRGQDQISSGATSEWTNQDPAVSIPIPERTLSTADLETQLKLLIRHLSVPLNMYEVARKVLGIGLPERLYHVDPGIPSDLNAHRHRGYKFPSVSPLLSSTGFNPNLGDPRGDGEPSEGTFPNGLTRTTSFRETIPLPLLLEIRIIDKPNTSPRKRHTNHVKSGIPVHGECLTDTKDYHETKKKEYGVTLVGGHKLLLEGSQRVDGLIEQLISKSNRTGISLSETTQERQEHPDSDGQSDLQILVYNVPEKGLFTTHSRREDSDLPNPLNATDTATNIMDVAKHDSKAKTRTFVEDLCSKFVGQKASFENQESRQAKRCLETDPSLCPIPLCFTDLDEELEPGELKALEDMQANFLHWQQSFPLYKSSH